MWIGYERERESKRKAPLSQVERGFWASRSFWESKAGRPTVNYRRSHLEYAISLVCSNSSIQKHSLVKEEWQRTCGQTHGLE